MRNFFSTRRNVRDTLDVAMAAVIHVEVKKTLALVRHYG